MFKTEILLLSWLAACTAWAEVVPFDSPRWRVSAAKAEVTGSGAEAVLSVADGGAWLEGLEVENAEVRFEMLFGPQRGFMGLAFRVADEQNYEHFYVRPHQSGQPDANQYTPVYSGISAWQLYHGPAYSVPLTYVTDEWVEMRIVFHGKQAEVWFGEDESPVLSIPDLKRPVASGALGVTGHYAPAQFRNFRWREIEEWSWSGQPGKLPEAPAGAIRSFEVSAPFPEARLDKKWTLPVNLVTGLEWRTVASEESGLLNIASVADRGPEGTENTVLVRHRVRVEQGSVGAWSFGFSDRVRAYCDGRLAYTGTDLYRSRDYRFLGTIGFFDTVVCDLDEGDHEIVFAVTESFGGWGIQAAESIVKTEAELFGAGALSTPAPEFATSLTADGKTVYFNRAADDRSSMAILMSRLVDDAWSEADVVSFTGVYSDVDPFITADGSRLFFSSNRPVEGETEPGDFDLWAVDRDDRGHWGEPVNLGPPVNTDASEVYSTLSSNGNLYFSSKRDGERGLYVSRPVDGHYSEPERLNLVGDASDPMSAVSRGNPAIAPDETFLVFVQNVPGGFGGPDLYVSYQRDGVWSAPVNLGEKVNSPFADFAPNVSPDGIYLYWTSERPGLVPAGVEGRPPGDLYRIEWSSVSFE